MHNTDNPDLLVHYLNEPEIFDAVLAIANDRNATHADLYRAVRPALIAAPKKPYTNRFIDNLNRNVTNRVGSPKSIACVIIELVCRNRTWNVKCTRSHHPVRANVETHVLTDEELGLTDVVAW